MNNEDDKDLLVIDKYAKKNYPSVDDLSNQELLKQYLDGEYGIKFGQHAYIIACIMLYVGTLILIVFGIIWALHLILPIEYKWLSDAHVQGIERILFSSIIVSIAGKYFRKYKLLDAKQQSQ